MTKTERAAETWREASIAYDKANKTESPEAWSAAYKAYDVAAKAYIEAIKATNGGKDNGQDKNS